MAKKNATKASAKGKNKKDGKGKSKKLSPSPWMTDLRYGQSVSLEFFRKNAWILIPMLVAVIALIGLRYKTKTRMEEIKVLTHKLEVAESEKLQEKASYMSLIRETEMKRLVAEKNLGLVFQEQPPYEITLE